MPVRISRRIAAESLRTLPVTTAAAMDLTTWRPLAMRRAHQRGDVEAYRRQFEQWARRAIAQLRIDLRLDGLHLVDPCESYVVVALHESFIDVPVVAHLPLPLVFSARSELVGWPTLGRFLRGTGQIVISDESPLTALRALIREGSEHLAHGRSVVVFPQGSVLGIETRFQAGAFQLARRTGAKILPLVVAGGHRVWDYPFSSVVRLGQPVFARVLAPRDVDDSSELEATMKQIAIENTHAAPRRFHPERDGWWDGYRYEIDEAFTDLAEIVRRHRRPDSAGPGIGHSHER